MPALLLTVFAIALLYFLPSGVIDLRMQESIFPVVGIGIFIAGLLFLNANKAFGCLMGYLIILCVLRFTPDSYGFMALVIIYGAFYLGIVAFYDSINKYRNLIFNILCTLVLLNIVWIALQKNGIYWGIYQQYTEEGSGFFSNRLETGIFLATCLPFFFRGTRMAWGVPAWLWGIPAVFISLIWMRGMTAFLVATIVSYVYLFIKYGKKLEKKLIVVLLVIAISSVGVFGIVRGFGSYGIRLQAFERATVLIMEKPLLGWGIGQGQYVFSLFLNAEQWTLANRSQAFNMIVMRDDWVEVFKNKYKGDHNFANELWPEIHNEYLQIALDAGCIALILFLWVIYSHLRMYWKTKEKDILVMLSIVAILISANSFFCLQIGRFPFILIFMSALIAGQYRKETNGTEKEVQTRKL